MTHHAAKFSDAYYCEVLSLQIAMFLHHSSNARILIVMNIRILKLFRMQKQLSSFL